jgi:hypothetical protein
VGTVVGPELRSTPASAQTLPATPTPTGTSTSNVWNTFLDKLAGTLNIQRSALDSAITTAGTSTVDEAVQQGSLTQAQADALKARIRAGDFGVLRGGRGGKLGGARIAELHEAMRNASAQALGITTDALTTQLRSGQTLAQIAQANGKTEQAVIDAVLAAAKTQLDQAVTAGTLTRAQADNVYAELQQRGSNLLLGGGRGHGGRGRGFAPTSPQASPAPSTPATPSSTTSA